MPRPRSYHSNKGVETGGPEWSYSQFVIGIAVAIVFGVTCFAIGYVIATYDRPIEVDGRIAKNDPPATPAPDGTPVEAAPVEEAPTIIPPKKPEETIKRPDPRPTEITALPSSRPNAAPMVVTPVPLPSAPTPIEAPVTVPAGSEPETTTAVSVPVAEPAPVAAPAPAPEPTPAPAPSPAPILAPTPAPTPAPAPITPPADAPIVTKGSWGIQVAFFDGKDRKKQAESVKQRLKSSASQESNILISGDGKEYRVVISGFADRDAAKGACEKLKAKTGFADAWVKRLP